jgi:hypothetical protein
MNEDINDTATAEANTRAVVVALSKLYQAVVVHRSYRRGGHFTRGTLDEAREALKDLPRPVAVSWRIVAKLAKRGWGAEDCCRLAIASLEEAREVESKTLREMKVSGAEMLALGNEAPTTKLWRSICIMDVAIQELGKPETAERLARKTWALANKVGRELERGGAKPFSVAEAA